MASSSPRGQATANARTRCPAGARARDSQEHARSGRDVVRAHPAKPSPEVTAVFRRTGQRVQHGPGGAAACLARRVGEGVVLPMERDAREEKTVKAFSFFF